METGVGCGNTHQFHASRLLSNFFIWIQMSAPRPLIMIADDNTALASALACKFEQVGFDTIVAADGESALEVFRSNRIAAIVSDHQMPRMTGLELCRTVRQQDSSIPFVLVTGRQEEILASGVERELDIRDVFGKPFNVTAVIASIQAAVLA